MRFVPHTVAVLHIPILLALGYATTNFGAVAFAGRTVGAAEDPIVILCGILVGAAASKWWQLLLAVLTFSTALHFYIVSTNEFATGSLVSFAARASAMASVGFATNLVRLLVESFGRQKPDPA